MKNSKLFTSLSKIKGNAIASIETKSQVKLTGGKKNPMMNRVEKVTSGGSVQFFGNSKSNGYLSKKKRLAEKDGIDPETIELKKRPWGTRIDNTPLVEHNGKFYAELIYIKPPKVKYLLDGKPIEKTDIVGMPKSKKTNEIVLRTMKLETITKFKCGDLSV